MTKTYSPAVLQGKALGHVLLEAIEAINEHQKLGIMPNLGVEPVNNPALLADLMNTLKVDLFWHEEYNGIEQSVVEADCTLAGPIREASEIDAVASDVMTAVYRAVIIYAFGNEVEVPESLVETSTFSTGIQEGDHSGNGSSSVKKQAGEGWVDWQHADQFVGKRVLIRFKNLHIEDATIHLDDDGGAYYVLFDGQTLISEPIQLMLIPEKGWDLWMDAGIYANQSALIRFSSGHIEDAEIFKDVNGALRFKLYDENDISDTPVAAMPLPVSTQQEEEA